ncbi:MAG TPA: tetratricopeptide repeat protein, partial [Blastocatellia bacterium]|nr:tetratricopeptide repeat protein [Blastocatellia bacterium]
GICALKLGKLEDAERDLEESLKISIELWGTDSINVAGDQANLAKVLVRKQDLSDFERALELAEGSYKTCRRVLKEEHAMTGAALVAQACALWRLGQRDRAEEMAARGIACTAAQMGPEDKDVIEQQNDWNELKKDFP